MMWGNIISTQSLFHGIYSSPLAGNLPYFIFDRFFTLASVKKIYFLPSFRMAFLMPGSKNVGKSSPKFYTFLDEGDMYGTNVIRNFGLLTE